MRPEAEAPTKQATANRGPTTGGPRWPRLLGLGVGLGLGIPTLALLPDLVRAIPFEIQHFVRCWTPSAWLVAAGSILTIPRARALLGRALDDLRGRLAGLAARGTRLAERAGRPARAVAAAAPLGRLAILDRPAAWALRGPLTVAAAAAALLLLASWVPEYLTWPFWADHDQFAMTAQAWDSGILPYRDLADFDFPGPTYVFWALGKVFGWGRTVAYYALDAGLLMSLGLALAIWSRRLFGAALPGLAGFLLFLGYYLGLDVTQASQRDWQAPLLIVFGVLAQQAGPVRVGRLASALATAAAFAFRPHVVLLLPAVLSAVDEGARRRGAARMQAARAVAEWSAMFAGSLLLASSPLILAGVLDDFARVLQVANYGNSYNKATFTSFQQGLRKEIENNWLVGLLAANVLLGAFGPERLRRTTRTWALALIGVLLYKPLSPVQHQYLEHPLALIWPINAAVLLGWVLSTRVPGPAASLRLLAVAIVLLYGMPRIPRYCNARRSLQACDLLVHGYRPGVPPQGCENILKRKQPGAVYNWTDYCATLAYLRHATTPETRVANVFRGLPFPAINGPAGRMTPFPAAGGVIYPSVPPEGRDVMLAEALDRAPDDSVVAWIPHEPNVYAQGKCPLLTRAIHRHYRPEIRFGWLEVWRRKPGTTPEAQGDVPPRDRASASAP